ncbi:hypothetical protein ACFLT1_08535 [Bacteroidota bacterium]
MSKSTSASVRKIIAYILTALVLLFSIIAILAIWDIIEYRYLVKRMFQSLMVIMATSAVIVLIFAILDRPEKDEK